MCLEYRRPAIVWDLLKEDKMRLDDGVSGGTEGRGRGHEATIPCEALDKFGLHFSLNKGERDRGVRCA